MGTRALGTDDSVTTCDCCGKSNLKFTVAMELDDGVIVHYGQVCARRNTGKDQRALTSEMKAEAARKVAAARADFLATPEHAAEMARLAERNSLPWNHPCRQGMQAANFVREAVDAAMAVRKSVAAKHGISVWGF